MFCRMQFLYRRREQRREGCGEAGRAEKAVKSIQLSKAYEFVVLLNLNQFCEMVIWRKKMVGWVAAGGQNKIMESDRVGEKGMLVDWLVGWLGIYGREGG
ncbi:hypothetical protein SDJN02_15298, partial [Cucurbita argyrosperma subsp. argyrosperma]